MRPHHFVLILVGIVTFLWVCESVLSLPHVKRQPTLNHEAVLVTPWSGGS